MIQLQDLTVNFDDQFWCRHINWIIEDNQHWLVAGTNGAGKSALAAILAGAGDIEQGCIDGLPAEVAVVSFEAQEQLIEAERRKDDADILDVISEGTPVAEIIAAVSRDQPLANMLVEQFGIAHLQDRAFRKLSTGESRKVMLIRALSSKPALLILDEPFEGLDVDSSKALKAYLDTIHSSVTMVLVLNRLDDCPDFVTHAALVQQGELAQAVSRSDADAMAALYQLLHLQTADIEVPPAEPESALPELDPSQPLVRLNKATIRYGDVVIFENISWTINRGEHWQLSGPNGSGKTAMLSLITGDHPQCYTNDIFVFGFQRGTGETIWQIKQFIGYVSTALQWEYRVSISLRNVIISGFYDSIGLYTKYTETQRNIADQWLAVLGLQDKADEPFNKLSYGDQRLLLIARAMVKHPPLLILDEPCLGLDDMNRRMVLALIERICASSESTVLYVNHHAEDKVAGIDRHLKLTGKGSAQSGKH